MRQVTYDEFFKVVNPLDVMPSVDESTLRDRVHVSHWKIQSTRELVGTIKSDSWGIDKSEYFLVK